MEIIAKDIPLEKQREELLEIDYIKKIDNDLKEKYKVEYNSITVWLGSLLNKIEIAIDTDTFIKNKIYSKIYDTKIKISNWVWRNKDIQTKDKNNKIIEIFDKIADDLKENIDYMLDNTIYYQKNIDNSIDFVYFGDKELDYQIMRQKKINRNYEIDKAKKTIFGELLERNAFDKTSSSAITESEIKLTVKENKDYNTIDRNNTKTEINKDLCLMSTNGQKNKCSHYKNKKCYFGIGIDNTKKETEDCEYIDFNENIDFKNKEIELTINGTTYKYSDNININAPLLEAGYTLDDMDKLADDLINGKKRLILKK